MKTRFILFIMLTSLATSTVMPMAINQLINHQANEESPDFNADFDRVVNESQTGKEIFINSEQSQNPKKRKAPSSDDESTDDAAALPPLKKQKPNAPNSKKNRATIVGLEKNDSGFSLRCSIAACGMIYFMKNKFNILRNFRNHLRRFHQLSETEVEQIAPYLRQPKTKQLPKDVYVLNDKYRGGIIYYSDTLKKYYFHCDCSRIVAFKLLINIHQVRNHQKTKVHRDLLAKKKSRESILIESDSDNRE